MFTKANKQQAKLHMLISGISGGGKSLTSLLLAREFGSKIAAVDTEKGSLSKYADIVPFDVVEMSDDFSPERLIEAIKAAETAGYDSLVVDSGTLFWTGTRGFLDRAQDLEKRGKGNSYTVWKVLDPLYRQFIQSIVSANINIFYTLREKTEHDMKKDEKGKLSIQKVGMAPVMREQFEYEFDLYGSMNSEHELVIHKSRLLRMVNGQMVNLLDGKIFNKPGKELADIIKQWMVDGSPRELVKHGNPILDEVSLAIERINGCTTVTELEALAPSFKNLDIAKRTIVADAYKSRKQALA